MTTTAAQTRYTPADVARLSDQTGKLYELVGGALVEKRVSTTSNFVAAEVVFVLRSAFRPDKAYVFVEQPTYCFDADLKHGRRPDVALVWANRLTEGLTDDELYIPPDLVVEIVSPTNRYSEQQRRVNLFLGAGVPMVWVVDPHECAMHVYRGLAGPVDYLREGDVFQNDPHLPGLRFEMREILPPQKATTPA